MQCRTELGCPRDGGDDGVCWWHAAARLTVPTQTPLGVEHGLADSNRHPPGWPAVGHIGAWSELTW